MPGKKEPSSFANPNARIAVYIATNNIMEQKGVRTLLGNIKDDFAEAKDDNKNLEACVNLVHDKYMAKVLGTTNIYHTVNVFRSWLESTEYWDDIVDLAVENVKKNKSVENKLQWLVYRIFVEVCMNKSLWICSGASEYYQACSITADNNDNGVLYLNVITHKQSGTVLISKVGKTCDMNGRCAKYKSTNIPELLTKRNNTDESYRSLPFNDVALSDIHMDIFVTKEYNNVHLQETEWLKISTGKYITNGSCEYTFMNHEAMREEFTKFAGKLSLYCSYDF